MTSETKSNKANFMKKTANTVFFRYSPADISITRKNFESFFSDIGPVKKCSLIRQDKAKSGINKREAKGYGFCKFTAQEDAVSAANSLNETDMQWEYGQKVKVWVEVADKASNKKETQKEVNKPALPEGTPGASSTTETSDEILALQAKKRTSRVILRNLSFYATEHNIRQIMEDKFGEVVDINLPLVPAQNDSSGKKRRNQHRGFAFVTFANQNSAHKAVDACAGDEQIMIKKRPVAIDFSVSKFQHKRMQEEGGNKKEASTDSESGSDSSDGSSGGSDGDNGSASSDDDSDSDSGSESEEDVEEEDKSVEIPQNSHQHSLFLRNLPFDATRHDLFTLFSQYGHIAGIFLVKDRDTGIGKGTAFIKFSKEGGCLRALQASRGDESDANEFRSGKNIADQDGISGGGLYLNGRRIFIDVAVDKNTADSLKVKRDEDGKPIDRKIGKDKRNLYLKGEGRIENNGDDGHNPDAFENLPPSDQQKRGRAHQEKSTKLRSPLFFFNPLRLSIRNLAKQIDETQLKNLISQGIENGLKNELVAKDDIVANWRSNGDLDTRAIVEKLALSEKEGTLIPAYNEKKIKSFIPSVFIDRDFQATMKQVDKSKAERLVAPSRGFGFVEFTHHAHALACLRELNNNTKYSSEFVAGGRRAMEMRKQRKRKKKVKPGNEEDDGPSGADFIGDDGRVRVPRLIIEFTVENKAKARKQAENKMVQLDNVRKQKLAAKTAAAANSDGNEEPKKKKKGRGAQQRAKKRKMIEEGLLDKDGNKIEQAPSKKMKQVEKEESVPRPVREKIKGTKPPKKMKKSDIEEDKFEDMVQTYKNAFSGSANEKKSDDEPSNPRKEVSDNRWFD